MIQRTSQERTSRGSVLFTLDNKRVPPLQNQLSNLSQRGRGGHRGAVSLQGAKSTFHVSSQAQPGRWKIKGASQRAGKKPEPQSFLQVP